MKSLRWNDVLLLHSSFYDVTSGRLKLYPPILVSSSAKHIATQLLVIGKLIEEKNLF